MFRQNIKETLKIKFASMFYVLYYVCLKYDIIKWEYGAYNNYIGLHRPKLNKNMQIDADAFIYITKQTAYIKCI